MQEVNIEHTRVETIDLKLRRIQRNLQRLYKLLDKKPSNRSYLTKVKQSLEDLKKMVESPSCNEEFDKIESESFRELVYSLQELSMKGFCLLEKELTSKEMNQKCVFEKYHNDIKYRMFNHAVKAGISSKSNVLVIGCGGFPLSCLVLAKKFNCQVTGVDYDRCAIESANNLKEELELVNVQFHLGRGEDCIVGGFTHIVIASLVSNKKEVLDHLHEVCTFEQLVLCRYGVGLQQVINYPLGELDVNKWKEQWLVAEAGSMYRTLAIRKN